MTVGSAAAVVATIESGEKLGDQLQARRNVVFAYLRSFVGARGSSRSARSRFPPSAYFLSSRQTAQYSSSADVYVNQQNIASALTGSARTTTRAPARAVETQASLADVPAVAARALAAREAPRPLPQALLGQTRSRRTPTTNILTFTRRRPLAGDRRAARDLVRARLRRVQQRPSSKPIVKARHELEAAIATSSQGRRARRCTTASGEGPAAADAPDAADVGHRRRSAAPARAHRSRRTRSGMRRSASILGIMLGLGLAFGLEALDTRIRSSASSRRAARRAAAARPHPAADQADAEAQRAGDGRAAEAQRGRGVPPAADEPRVRAAERRRRPHDPRDERAREGRQVDDRRQPRGRRGSRRQAGRRWSTSICAGLTSTASSV